MSYSGNLRTFVVARGAPEPRGRAALQRCLRPAPILDTSRKCARGQSPPKIAASLGCAARRRCAKRYPRLQRAWPRCALVARSSRPKRVHAAFGEESSEALKELCCTTLRERVWRTDEPLDAGRHRGGEFRGGPHRQARVSGETIRATLSRLAVRWERAKTVGSRAPRSGVRSGVREEKGALKRLIRLAESNAESGVWAMRMRPGGAVLSNRVCIHGPRLKRADAPSPEGGEKGRPPPEGSFVLRALYLPELRRSWLRFVDGRPVSAITTQFLSWSCQRLEALGKKALCFLSLGQCLLAQESKFVKEWIAAHNRRVKNSGHGVRIEYPACCPRRARGSQRHRAKVGPHGKRKVVEPERVLGAYELADRVCEDFGCVHEEHLSIPQVVA
jgi:hypothetical protein